MIQLTVEEFAANLHEYLDNAEEQEIKIIRKGKNAVKLFVLDEPKSPSFVEELLNIAGPLDLPEDFNLKEFKMQRLLEKHENLD
ncbi:MAG: hypothetical protein FWC67_01925 [Defluviitaleaceae bacterium]|nr:hypothetical protein [Defluviitaleaceae bacterium]